MKPFRCLMWASVFVSPVVFLSISGCTTRKTQSDYDSVYKYAALVFELKLQGDNPGDREMLKAKFIGQSITKVVDWLELARKRTPRNAVVEWVQQAKRIEIRVCTELVNERMAYEVSVFSDENGIVRDLYWNTASYPGR